MQKNALATVFYLLITSATAETVSFPSFDIDLADGWEYVTEPISGNDLTPIIRIRRPDGIGVLSIRSFDAPGVVNADVLRGLTNVEHSIDLAWTHWGEYSGYHLGYVENDTYYRHWWLAHERTILLISYDCDPAQKDIEAVTIDTIVRSITAHDAAAR